MDHRDLHYISMMRRPPRITVEGSSAASDVYKGQGLRGVDEIVFAGRVPGRDHWYVSFGYYSCDYGLSLIHISAPTSLY